LRRRNSWRTIREREQAQEKVDQHTSGREKLARDLRKKLTPDTHKPKGRTLPKSPKDKDVEPER
jgi:hypothetical protein